MICGVVISGASVTSVRPPRSEVSSPSRHWRPARAASPDRARPLRADVQERSFDMDAEHARALRPRSAARTAAMARATMSRSALISVGRKPVVPKRRCAAPMARMESTLGASLKSTPPPPFTCESMKPGSSSCPPRSYCSALRQRASDAATMSRMRLPSSSTHRPRRSRRRASTRAVDERDGHQTVSVTLFRCGGRSGSRPRAIATARWPCDRRLCANSRRFDDRMRVERR